MLNQNNTPVRTSSLSRFFNTLFFAGALAMAAFVMNGCRKETTPAEEAPHQVSLAEAMKLSEENLGIPVAGLRSGEEDACSHWDYDNTEWETLGCSAWSECGGQAQTPVNISNAVKSPQLRKLQFKWKLTRTTIVNNGHTIQFNCDPGSKLIANGKEYELLQFHYHNSSEHTINSRSYPLEVHYVHRAADNSLAVVGIMFKKGAPHPLFSRFLQHFPTTMGVYTSNQPIVLDNLLPDNLSYYNYNGSLTTPPCSEIVNWHVIKGTVTASQQQLDALAHIMHQNNRPLQPLNGRIIREYDSRNGH